MATTGSRTRKGDVARRAWELMFDFFVRTVPRRSEAMARRGLTPNDLRALGSLAEEDGRTMGALAEAWQCDASNATLIVDRLERAGLAERRRMPGDARFRTVHLTPKGRRTYAELLEEFHTPPPEMLALTTEELRALERMLARIAGGTGESGERQ
ncbi:MAG TPA: MarR family transcriptional regulator [Longimicrobiales bacterium]